MFSEERLIEAMGADPVPVSRETGILLERYDQLLMAWSAHTNLVAKSTLEDRWSRHYADSLQLVSHMPRSFSCYADFGAGAGFPGLILAILYQALPTGPVKTARFYLIESIGKKCRFLNEAVNKLGLKNVVVCQARIESVHMKPRPDVITARALTALPGLLDYAYQHLAPGGVCLFPKGRRYQEELTAAGDTWNMQVIPHQSRTDPAAAILEIKALSPRKR